MIEAAEPPHQHHHKTGLPWFDLILPLAILCISVASLLTASQSEKSMHALVEQNTRLVNAQSTPLLMLDTGNTESDIVMTLSNVGTGPAQVAWFRVLDDQGNDFADGHLYSRIMKLDSHLQLASSVISANFIRSGDERLVFKWQKPIGSKPALAEYDKLNETRFHLHAKACYCSIFDECRTTEFGMSHPKPVASCEAASKL